MMTRDFFSVVVVVFRGKNFVNGSICTSGVEAKGLMEQEEKKKIKQENNGSKVHERGLVLAISFQIGTRHYQKK